ncbi:MAG: DNA repair protein RadA, partial [Candidatus Melainabacteria bacterium]|nr:DNA repair protein RadA [Candidatus Melainabacteria bacterium]
KDTAVELAIALAIYNSAVRQSNDKDIIALGELGLSGEIRSVTDIEARIKEAIKLGYKQIIVPESNFRKLDLKNLEAKIIAAKNINQLVKSSHPKQTIMK